MPAGVKWGENLASQWQGVAKLMQAEKSPACRLRRRPPAYTNELIDEINKFDAKAVAEEAKADEVARAVRQVRRQQEETRMTASSSSVRGRTTSRRCACRRRMRSRFRIGPTPPQVWYERELERIFRKIVELRGPREPVAQRRRLPHARGRRHPA